MLSLYMNCIIQGIIRLYEYLTCVKCSKMSLSDTEEYDIDMEYSVIYDKKL